jgi:pyruvyltransferase
VYTENDRARVFWWTPPRRFTDFRRRENAGDYFAPVVVDRILARRGLRIADKLDAARQLFTIGSVLHFAKDHDTVWGSGVNGKIAGCRHAFRNLDVRAVRGPLTAEFLRRRGIGCPNIFGDPASLLPTLYPELASPHQRNGTLLVLHLHDRRPAGWRGPILLATAPWRVFAKAIARSAFVVSSSLHGIILAEAYGIPARWLAGPNGETEFKYIDYLSGSGRPDSRPARSIGEAVEMGGETPPSLDLSSLIDAFPYDLWPAGVAGDAGLLRP